MKTLLSASDVRSILDYNKETGIFTWKTNRPPRGIAGAVAGYENGSGYIKISIFGKRYYAHRLAFLWMTGEWPDHVDHINGSRWDNRWANLRSVSQKTNMANVPGRSGIRNRYGRWYARYSSTHLGSFATKEQAIEARRAAELAAAGLDPQERCDAPETNFVKKRKSYGYVFNGRSLSEWSNITGIKHQTLYWRIVIRGQDPAVALSKIPRRQSP